jgi:2-dehydro-3-deoxyphosphogluconate aldolase/(4S)-4-hydroxy-2-oxoglutarate aldolase
MPTGGIDLNDFKTWFEAGASAVGMGSSLISRKSMDAKEFEPLRSKLRSVIDQIAAIRASGTKL